MPSSDTARSSEQAHGKVAFGDALAMAEIALATDDPLLHYFETPVSGARLGRASDALACAMADLGVRAGDRVVVQLQNMPQFHLSLLAIWKLGAIAVPANPMLRARELSTIMRGCRPTVLVTLDVLYHAVAAPAAGTCGVTEVITTSGLDFLTGEPPSVLLADERVRCPGTHDLVSLLERYEGQRPAARTASPETALLVYTSGTTGPPKGAMVSHANLVFSATIWRDWCSITPADVSMGIAPLFHITGLVACVALPLLSSAPVVLGYRFDPAQTLALMEHHGVSFTVAAITAFTALMNVEGFDEADLSRLRVVQSGGAPVAPAIVDRWERLTGTYIHNAYGMTETTAPTHFVPIGSRAPVDPTSGSLSVGIPVHGTQCEIQDDRGRPLPPGEIGQLVTGGPQVVPGYWETPEETVAAFPDGRIRTGDVGFVDDNGWFYIVDRSKDLIVASGYKVWPREVEDVLMQHAAIREAAVIGVADDYRGETVKAFVSLRAGGRVDEAELITYCRERLAAYKRPHSIEIMDELPKTVSGKILRRELRTPERRT
jgi:long-chain acyl-CoA synthetase